MRYINSTLPDNEKIILEVELHWIRKFLAWFYLIFFGIFIIGIYLFVKIMIENWTTEQAVTEKRVIKKIGWIKRATEEISLNRIEEVNFKQSILQRIFGAGDINIRGTGGGELRFVWIENPTQVHKTLNQLRS